MSTRVYPLILIFGLLSQSIFSQNTKHNYFSFETPYELKWKKDIFLSGGAAALYGIGLNTIKNEPKPEFSIGNFSKMDVEAINYLDRSFAGTWNPTAKSIGKPFVNVAAVGIPLGLLAFPGNLKSRAKLALIFYEGYYATGGIVTLSKGLTNRYRPFTYVTQEQVDEMSQEFREEFLEDIEGSDIEDSFFSGDAAKTAYGFIFFAKAFSDYFPDSKYKKIVWGTSIAAITVQGYFRVQSGKHFPTDVIVGSLVGGSIAYLLPHLHKKKGDNLSIGYIPNGLAINYHF